MEVRFSDKLREMKPSAIREIFKSLGTPGAISFAGGNPAPESFPSVQAVNTVVPSSKSASKSAPSRVPFLGVYFIVYTNLSDFSVHYSTACSHIGDRIENI